MDRIYLSPPHMGESERRLLLEAFDSNWIAPVGPHLQAFEEEMAATVGVEHTVAVASGTAALHLALLALDVGTGDDVLVSTLTFAASANAVTYVGARPVFVDSDSSSWNMAPDLLAEALERRARAGRRPAAVIVVDLYGQCADYEPIVEACNEHGVPIIEDAAEALGATYRGEPAGSFGTIGVFSFNGNKIITTSSGGMLVSRSKELVKRAAYLATQARQPVPHYEHTEVGYNYRMSNLLAAVGRGQLRVLGERVERRRQINDFYRRTLGRLPGVRFMPRAPKGRPTCWLTCLTIDPDELGVSREGVRAYLDRNGIEARPTWMPMHLQPVFAACPVVGGAVAESVFRYGLCLPSGSSLSDRDLERVVDVVFSAIN